MDAPGLATSHRIFVAGIPAVIAERQRLTSILSVFGVVEDVWVRRIDCTPGVHESWAFATFGSEAAAAAATAADESAWLAAGAASSLEVEVVSGCGGVLSHAAVAATIAAEEAKVLGPAPFEAVRRQVSRVLGRPAARGDVELISAALQERRRQMLGAASAAPPVDDGEVCCASLGVLIITAYSSDYAPGPVCEAVNRAYATRHSYQFHAEVVAPAEMLAAIAPRTAFTWYKVRMIRDAIRRAPAGGYHFIMWLDADAVVSDLARPLQSLVSLGVGRDLVIGEDLSSACLVNCGAMIIRATPWSESLWRQLWEGNLSRRFHSKPYHEQSALIRLLVEHGELEATLPNQAKKAICDQPQLSPHVCVLPHGCFQTSCMDELVSSQPFVFHAVCRPQSKLRAIRRALDLRSSELDIVGIKWRSLCGA